MIIKKVWGKLTADQVTVDIYAHYMADNEKRITKQVTLANDEAVADFDMQNGRRTEPLEQQQVAQAVKGQLAIGKQILAQQLNVVAAPTRAVSFRGPAEPAQWVQCRGVADIPRGCRLSACDYHLA